ALRLGFTSFGGPIAHLGFFREEYVRRRKWLDDETYADIVALCQFLPGPASSQVGIAIGMLRGGWAGGILSWLGFTFPRRSSWPYLRRFFKATTLRPPVGYGGCSSLPSPWSPMRCGAWRGD